MEGWHMSRALNKG